jgi:membrane-bound metal-dependent hydrolase YbcI (DUF457 family)
MLLTVHLLVGAIIGVYFEKLWIIIILSLVSHYILDMIPHYKMKPLTGYNENGFKGIKIKELLKKSAEPLFGLILFGFIIYLNKEKAIPILIAGFFAWFFPDFINFLGWKYKRLAGFRKLVPYPGNLFYHEAKSKIIGIVISIILSLACVAILFIISS